MKASPHRCPNCGLFFLSRELALLALFAGCPGCGQGLYGESSNERLIYRCADGTEIPLWPWCHGGASVPARPPYNPGPEPVSSILTRLLDEATKLHP